MSDSKGVTPAADNNKVTNAVKTVDESVEDGVGKAMAGMSEAFAEIEGENPKYYYLCGIRIKDGNKELDFNFPYTDSELKAAMMEEIQYNSGSEDERKEMTLEHKQKFSQGFLLASYRKRMNDVKICLFKSDEEYSKDKLQSHLNAISDDDLEKSEIQM